MKTKFSVSYLKHNCESPISFSTKDKDFCLVRLNSNATLDTHSGFISSGGNSFFLKNAFSELEIRSCQNDEKLNYDLFSFSGSDALKIIRMSNVDFDVLLSPLHAHFADSLFGKINAELKSKNSEWKKVVLAYTLEMLSKLLRLSNSGLSDFIPDHSQKLRDLRAEIHENYSKMWRIEDMANRMGLSPSRFASLYKNEFKISPTEDLIQTRIDQSKRMLSESKVSIKKVSAACGFESVHYFHRAFKKRSNVTPKHFQNKQLANEGSVLVTERHFSLDRLTQQAEYSGVIEFVNGEIRFHGNTDHVSSLLGYKPEVLREEPFTSFIHQDDHEIAKTAVDKILSNKNVLDLTINLIHKNGQKIQVNFSALLKGKNWFWFIKNDKPTLVN